MRSCGPAIWSSLAWMAMSLAVLAWTAKKTGSGHQSQMSQMSQPTEKIRHMQQDHAESRSSTILAWEGRAPPRLYTHRRVLAWPARVLKRVGPRERHTSVYTR